METETHPDCLERWRRHGFARLAAFDWSGAHPATGIALAVVDTEGERPRPYLVPPPEGARHWTRAAAAGWIAALAQLPGRSLIGIDAAFGLAVEVAAGLTGAEVSGPDMPVASQLWATIDRLAAGEPDFAVRSVPLHPDAARFFWTRGPRPPGLRLTPRATEAACIAAGLGRPQSPCQMIGAKQVGKASLTLMRVLHGWRARLPPGTLAVWPFAEAGIAPLTVAEIYPRIALLQAGRRDKVRDRAGVVAGLAALGAVLAEGAAVPERVGDHAADALLAVAWMARLDPAAALARAELSAAAVRSEGWILGVPLRDNSDLHRTS